MMFGNWSADLRGGYSFLFFGILLTTRGGYAQSDLGPIDHVRVVVRDIQGARDLYRNALGFDLFGPEPTIFLEGSAHFSHRFTDGTYLELIGVADEQKLTQTRPWIVEFLRNHEGAHSVGLRAPSAKAVSDTLRSRGVDAPTFSLTGTGGSKPILLVTPPLAHMPEGSIFFCQYPQANINRKTEALSAPVNAVNGIIAVWILVKDLDEGVKQVDALGFRRTRPFNSKFLGANGHLTQEWHVYANGKEVRINRLEFTRVK